MKKRYLFSLMLVAIPLASFADQDISAMIRDGWVVASQGRDESMQSARIKIWGSSRVSGEFHQLDDDPEQEFVVISRGTGSGPYYKLQIIEVPPHAILSWSYDSAGAPYVEDAIIYLGSLPNGYQGATTKPEYRKYKLSGQGLVGTSQTR